MLKQLKNADTRGLYTPIFDKLMKNVQQHIDDNTLDN
jgi:hypothetical protein